MHRRVAVIQAFGDGLAVQTVLIVVGLHTLAAERDIEHSAVSKEADAVGGKAAVHNRFAGIIQIVKALDACRIDPCLFQQIRIVENVRIAVADGVTDQIALTVRVGAAQCIPCIIKLLPALGVCIHIFLQRDAEVRICIHSDIFHCAGEHGREIFFLGRLQLGVALHLVALIYDGHMVLVLAVVEVINNVLQVADILVAKVGPPGHFRYIAAGGFRSCFRCSCLYGRTSRRLCGRSRTTTRSQGQGHCSSHTSCQNSMLCFHLFYSLRHSFPIDILKSTVLYFRQ